MQKLNNNKSHQSPNQNIPFGATPSLFHQSIKDILLNGCTVQIGRLNISPIERTFHGTRWQVDSNDSRCLFSQLYHNEDLDVAVDKFLLLMNSMYKNKKNLSVQ